MLLVSRLTATDRTPFTLPTLFSTAAEQAAQDMPVTLNLCFTKHHLYTQGGVHIHLIRFRAVCQELSSFRSKNS
jgi:hypothetical protein